MIQGVFYKGSDIDIEAETGIDLTGATVSILAKFPDGSTQEYTGEIKDFSTISATLEAADNTMVGEIFIQAKVVKDEKTAFGLADSLIILNNFVVPE